MKMKSLLFLPLPPLSLPMPTANSHILSLDRESPASNTERGLGGASLHHHRSFPLCVARVSKTLESCLSKTMAARAHAATTVNLQASTSASTKFLHRHLASNSSSHLALATGSLPLPFQYSPQSVPPYQFAHDPGKILNTEKSTD